MLKAQNEIDHPPKSFNVSQQFADDPDQGPLLALPREVMDLIIRHTDCQSLDNLLDAYPAMANFMEKRYIRQIQLPCKILPKNRRKFILHLSCNAMLKSLQDPFTSELPFGRLNLRYLKELKLGGLNKELYAQHQLSELYLHTLMDLLDKIEPTSLKKLEILTDGSERMCKLAAALAKFKSLEYVCLKGMSRDCHLDFYKIAPLFSTINTTKLDLKDYHINLQDKNAITNHSVRFLSLRIGKAMNIREFWMSNLIELEHWESWVCICLLHAGHGHLKNALFAGCPKLRFYNRLDLYDLPMKEKYPNWLANIESQGMKFHRYSVWKMCNAGLLEELNMFSMYTVLTIPADGQPIDEMRDVRFERISDVEEDDEVDKDDEEDDEAEKDDEEGKENEEDDEAEKEDEDVGEEKKEDEEDDEAEKDDEEDDEEKKDDEEDDDEEDDEAEKDDEEDGEEKKDYKEDGEAKKDNEEDGEAETEYEEDDEEEKDDEEDDEEVKDDEAEKEG